MTRSSARFLDIDSNPWVLESLYPRWHEELLLHHDTIAAGHVA